jgi:PAS domain S-box-containing protein
MKKGTTLKTPNQNSYFAVISESGTIQFANETLHNCLHLEKNNQLHRQFFNFLSATGNTDLKKALQDAGYASNPCCIKMDLLNSSVHKAAWHIVRLRTTNQRPALYVCIGSESDYEKPTNTKGAFNPAPAFGIIVQDAQANVIDTNSKAALLLGNALHENTNQPGNTSFVTAVTNWVSCENNPPMKALTSGLQCEQIIEARTSTQGTSLMVTSYPLFDDEGSVPFSVVTIIKEFISPQAQPLPESELIRKEFLQCTSAMNWVVDAQTEHIVHGNPAFLRFNGLTATDLQKNAAAVLPSLYYKTLAPRHRDVAATGVAHKKIYKLPLAHGTNSYFLVHIFPVPNSLGKLLVGGEAFDITFGYDVHEEVARANERLIRLSQVTAEAIWEWDLQSNHVFRNQQLQEMIGFHSTEMTSITWWLNRIHEDDRQRIETNIRHVLDNKLPSWSYQYRFLHANGNYRTVRDRGFVIYENGEPVKAIGSIADLTEIKELELQLVQEKIKHQKAITKSIIDTQEKICTKIGQELHDNINQLLLVTKLYVGLLKQPDAYDQDEIMGKIQESLSVAINDVRAMSRQMVLPKLTDTSLHESINKLVNDVKTTCKFDIQLSCRGQYDDHISEGKKVALYRIAQEQLKNIIHYSQASRVAVVLKSCPGYIELSISDNGIGFDPLKKSQGIGLRNIYDRTELYNGNVELRSAPGKGCTLMVRIPRCQ